MDAPEVVRFSTERYVIEDTSAWQFVDSDVMRKALHECIANRRYNEQDQYPAEKEAKGTEDGQHKATAEKKRMGGTPPSDQLKPGHDQFKEALLDLKKEYTKLLEGMGGEGKHFVLKDASFMHLLDTGGQPSFQDVLPLLLNVPCTYIQVFNAALSLDEPVCITYRSNDHPSDSLQGDKGRNMMLRSFSSMQTMAQKCSRELGSFLQDDSPQPKLRIFVVGTHKDQLKDDRLHEATQDITLFLEGLDGKPYYDFIIWDSKQPFFLINAMGGWDDRASVNRLRECLSCKGSPLKLDVPVMWFIFQEITRRTPKKFFRFQDLEAFCQKCGFIDGKDADSQFRALLQLFSLLGFYSFYNLKGVPDKDNFVCTDSGAFLREVSKLLAVQFMHPTSSRMRTFKDTGILAFEQELFKCLKISQDMDPHWFLEALQHLGIAAHLPCKDRIKKYFIPAVLPQSSAIQDPPASVAPLCLTYTIKDGIFSFTDMPRGVFCRLAVELIREEWKILKHENSRSLLKLREPRKKFEIFLKECPGYISIIPQAVVKFSPPSELHTACKSLISTVKKCLSDSTEDMLGNEFSSHAKLEMGFKCHCGNKDVPHLAIPAHEHEQFLECLLPNSTTQDYTQRQRIWFSSVEGVEVSISWRC